jgi:hypothetical protein
MSILPSALRESYFSWSSRPLKELIPASPSVLAVGYLVDETLSASVYLLRLAPTDELLTFACPPQLINLERVVHDRLLRWMRQA